MVYLVPGEGQGMSISWDPTDLGPPYAPRPSFVGLAHELIHGYIILHGLQYQSTNNAQGLAINEGRVVGLGGSKMSRLPRTRFALSTTSTRARSI